MHTSIARMIVEGAAYQLGEMPDQLFEDAKNEGCPDQFVKGVMNARDAYLKMVGPEQQRLLGEQFQQDIKEGLEALTETRRRPVRRSDLSEDPSERERSGTRLVDHSIPGEED